MARYEATINSPMTQEEAFEYMADLRHFEQWDPGVKSSTLVVGDEPDLGAEYDVEMALTTLRYKTTEYSHPQLTRVEARSTMLSSFDTIEVTSTPTGSTIHYKAVIELSGPLKLVDPLFGLVFNRIGDKAAVGMAKALRGRQVSST